MIGGLADRIDVVVAGFAGRIDRLVIHSPNRHPRCGPMAVVAYVVAEDVVDGLRARGNSATEHVAATALRRRALEDAGDMARFAVGRLMLAVEVKSRREMIEPRSE